MTSWEKKIIDAFISHYFDQPLASDQAQAGEDHRTLRIRSSVFFPDFDTVHPDEKESYLEAAESLNRKGIVSLRWEKRDRGERLKTLSCENSEKLFEEAGRPYPKTEAEKIRNILGAKVEAFKETLTAKDREAIETAKQAITLLEFLSQHFGPREIGQGLNRQTMEEFVRLLEFSLEPARLEGVTTRALSILLYRDSKHLENLLALCAPLLFRAQKNSTAPDFSFPELFNFLERSYPETMISGKLIFELKNSNTPMINAEGLILNLPLESAMAIENIKPISEKNSLHSNGKAVLTIENKETFYALGSPQNHSKTLSRYACFLYTGGYPNRATAALIKTLAASGFSFYHAGDLDPDGILILQYIQDIAKQPVLPLRMDAATFDQCRAWARPLAKSVLRQTEKIRKETRAIPELAGLLRRIEETGLGVEQEIVDYR